MFGNLFNFNKDYQRLNMNETKDVNVTSTSVKKKNICKQTHGRFYENFKDERQDETPMEGVGDALCDTLNAKQFGLPQTVEDHNMLVQYALAYMKAKRMEVMNIGVRGYVFSTTEERPKFGYKPTLENEEFFDLENDQVLNLDADVRSIFDAKVQISYQTKEKLCIILTVRNVGGEETARYNFDKCEYSRQDINAFCAFEEKVNIRLSGLCDKCQVDKNYALIEAKSEEDEGANWNDFYRYGTFSGKI